MQPPFVRASLTHWVTHAETGVVAEVGAGAGAERNESPFGTPSVWRSSAAAAEIAERRRNECPLSLLHVLQRLDRRQRDEERGGQKAVRETSAALPLSIAPKKVAIEQYKAVYQRAIWSLPHGTRSGWHSR